MKRTAILALLAAFVQSSVGRPVVEDITGIAVRTVLGIESLHQARSAGGTTATCPDSNGMIVLSNGVSFLIGCGVDHAGGDLPNMPVYVNSFQECIDTCATTNDCVDLALSGSACYLKSSVGSTVYDGVYGARVISPSGIATVGCFVDGGDRVLPRLYDSTSSQTPEQCALNCRSAGYRYSGTEYGQECWCGNYAPSSSAATSWGDCNMACSGDATQTCGAGNRIQVVIDTTWQQTLFVRESYSTWNLLSCYVDGTSGRTLPNGVSLDNYGGSSNATIPNCLSACADQGFTYCGEEYYSECFGSNSAPTSAVASGSDPLAAGCDYPCNGNKSEACGGSNRILVYRNN